MIAWATSRPAVIWAFGVALILAGAVAFFRLPLATRTTVELPRLQVRVSWPGAAAELVETYVTSPIESVVQGVRGVRQTSSESRDGESVLTIELESKVDVRLARLSVLERLETIRAEFPPGASQPQVSNYVPEDLSEEPLLQYTISGPYTSGALSELVRSKISPRVSAVAGVAGVNQFGRSELGVSVAYDAARLRQLDIQPERLAEALRGARVVQSLGQERLGATERRVVLRDEPRAAEQLADLPIAGARGRVFRLGELATVRQEEDAGGRFLRIDGQPAVGLDIARLPGADAIHTAARVRAVMDELSSTLPPGVRLRIRSDESVDLGNELRDLILRGCIAFAAVLMVLALTLRNARAVALVMGSAAIALAGTSLGLYLLNIPANLLTLAGLGMGIGIIVQDGVVVVERLRTAPDTAAGRAEAGRRITPALVGATLTTIVVLLPFLYLQGNARAAFVPFAAAFCLALLWSVIAAVIMIPAVGAGHGVTGGKHPRLARTYRWLTVRLLRWRWATLATTLLVLGVLGWGFATKVPRTSFSFWYGQRTTLSASLGFPRGSDPEALDRGMRDFESIVVGRPGVEQVITMGNPDRAYMMVLFEKAAGLTALPTQLQDELTQRAVLIGGANVGVQGQGPGFYAGGGGVSIGFRIKLLGYSFDGVERLARDLQTRLERIPRVRNVNINAGSFWASERGYTVTLQPDRPALGRYGLTATDFRQVIAREVRGPVGVEQIEIDGAEVPVNLKAQGARERTLDELRGALVPNDRGAPVRVGDVALVGEREALSQISREDQQYVRIVTYDFRGPQKLANRTHEAFMASISVPPGYSVGDDYFGWADDDSSRGLWLVFGLGVVLVLLSVALVFDSVWAAGMVFLSLPLALAGVAAAFWIARVGFSREAAVGVILVVGLSVHQAILLVDGALRIRREGARARGREDGPVAHPAVAPAPLRAMDVVHIARDRAPMIMLVTLTTLASLLPLAIGTDPDSLFGAIALATTGGTIAGTLGAMFVMPAVLVGVRRDARAPAMRGLSTPRRR